MKSRALWQRYPGSSHFAKKIDPIVSQSEMLDLYVPCSIRPTDRRRDNGSVNRSAWIYCTEADVARPWRPRRWVSCVKRCVWPQSVAERAGQFCQQPSSANPAPACRSSPVRAGLAAPRCLSTCKSSGSLITNRWLALCLLSLQFLVAQCFSPQPCCSSTAPFRPKAHRAPALPVHTRLPLDHLPPKPQGAAALARAPGPSRRSWSGAQAKPPTGSAIQPGRPPGARRAGFAGGPVWLAPVRGLGRFAWAYLEAGDSGR